jgi:hypothetical protein
VVATQSRRIKQMPETFHTPLGENQHGKFQQWRSNHPRGFVINRKAKAAGMIHRADCQHMGDCNWEADDGFGLAKSEKICDANREELSHWAEAHQVVLTICNDCMRG